MESSSSFRSKVVRPFKHADKFEGVMTATMRHSEVEQIYEASVSQDSDQFEKGEFQIALHFDQNRLADALKACGFHWNQISIVAFASGRLLKTTDIFLNEEISQEMIQDGIQLRLQVDDFPESLGDSFRGFDLTVALILNESLSGGALDIKYTGTWLDKFSCSVTPVKAGVGLDPRPMDGEKKKELEIQQSAFLHVEFDGSLTPEAEAGAVQVWVDAEFYAELFQIRKSPLGKATQRLLQRSVIASIVYQLAAELRGLDPETLELLVSDSLTSEISIFRGLLTGFNKGPFESLSDIDFAHKVIHNPEQVITRVEPSGFLATLKKGLAEDE